MTFHKAYLSKYKNNIQSMCNFHKLTNPKYCNSKLYFKQSFWIKYIHNMPYFTFDKSYICTEFLPLTLLQSVPIISYGIPLSKHGCTMFTSHTWLNFLLPGFSRTQLRIPIAGMTHGIWPGVYSFGEVMTLKPCLLD